MDSVSVSELKDTLSAVLNRAVYGRERIIIASRGKPKAAVIGLADLQWLEALEEAHDAAQLAQAIAAEADTRWYTAAEVEAELEAPHD